jgi:hypothetical protein
LCVAAMLSSASNPAARRPQSPAIPRAHALPQIIRIPLRYRLDTQKTNQRHQIRRPGAATGALRKETAYHALTYWFCLIFLPRFLSVSPRTKKRHPSKAVITHQYKRNL